MCCWPSCATISWSASAGSPASSFSTRWPSARSPGPLFTTATFIGYVTGGLPGALLATVGIFLPSFVFVLATNPFIPRLRRSPWLSGLLDGVNVAALGLMAAVTLELGQDALRDGVTVALAASAAVLLVRFKINSTWLILGGGIIGLARSLLS